MQDKYWELMISTKTEREKILQEYIDLCDELSILKWEAWRDA